MDPDQSIEKICDILNSSSYVVFLGGAGVSTESGIPDFRSKGGLYHKKQKRFSAFRPEYLLSNECLRKKPEVFFEYYRKNLDARKVEPNAAHMALAAMEKEGRLEGIITQNIDGLHQKAGSRNVQEIHGTIWSSHCMSCGKAYDVNYIFDSAENVPRCAECGGIVRPDVTLYGEMLPGRAYDTAIGMIRMADCLIIGGTSLEVGSAAQLAHMYHGKSMIIINKTKTKLEGRADVVIHDSIGKVLSGVHTMH